MKFKLERYLLFKGYSNKFQFIFLDLNYKLIKFYECSDKILMAKRGLLTQVGSQIFMTGGSRNGDLRNFGSFELEAAGQFEFNRLPSLLSGFYKDSHTVCSSAGNTIFISGIEDT